MPDSAYFAATKSEEVVEKLLARVEKQRESTLNRRYAELLRTCYQNFYTVDITNLGSDDLITRGGDQGELLEHRTNHARALVGVLLNLVTAQKLSWAPSAVNIDFETLQELRLATSVLEWLWQVKGVAGYMAKAVESAIAFSEGFVLVEWDPEAGEDVAPILNPDGTPTGRMVRSGDVAYRNLEPWNVLRDPSKPSWDALDSVTLLIPWNRFDLAARHPEQIIKILECEPENRQLPNPNKDKAGEDCEDVVVHRFIHKPCAVLPWGRDVGFLSNGTLLWDTILRGGIWPLFRITPAERKGTPYGYSQFFDVLGLQEIFDGITSSISTNQTTFATQAIAVEQGTTFNVEDLAGGMKVVYYPAGTEPPKALQLTSSPPESFGWLKDLKNNMELTFGLNSIVRGEAQSDKMSGTAMALLQTQALQQSGSLQGTYIRAVEECGSASLKMFREFADEPRKISLVGRQNSFAIADATISKKSFGKINRVSVGVGNPLANTPAGRMEMANGLLQMGLVRTPETYSQVLESGRLDPMVKGQQDVLMLIASENEMMLQGQVPQALVTDDALLHCREHASVVSNPKSRRDPKVIEAYMQHLIEHYAYYYGVPLDQVQMDPFYRENIMRLAGVQPPPPPMMPPGMPPPGAPGPEGAPTPPAPPAGPDLPGAPKLPEPPPLPPGATDPSQGPPPA